MRSPQWMIAYAAVLVLAVASYAALALVGQTLAFIISLLALAAMIVAVLLVIFR